MRKSIIIVFSLSILLGGRAFSQRSIDVLHYRFAIELNDQNDTIKGGAFITFVCNVTAAAFSFDLANMNDEGKGMIVSEASFVQQDLRSMVSRHANGKLIISSSTSLKKGDTATVYVNYKGIPADGLIISRNKYGQRTFFSDNWPDRAHHWIPCIDDPRDKASVEFIVTAPSQYKVVSNGIFTGESNLPGNKKTTRWYESIPLPTKIIVIGVAAFAVDTAGIVNGIPVTSWVFPENRKDGFHDYAVAKNILGFFIDYIGPYPYKKLANVQSKTSFGGMENASAIFYPESSITGRGMEERLVAHEITHQWFGDMVTEKNFAHLWLSEGFADYLSNIFLESKYGADTLAFEMKKDRMRVVAFAEETSRPVVDSVSPYMDLLNANSYQKGGWVLHMLRRQLGDSIFRRIIREYYSAYAGKNAETKDFQKIAEHVSGKSLQIFFRQWLHSPGHPGLDIKWSYSESSKNIILVIEQLQEKPFEFPLDIQIQGISGNPVLQTISISKQKQEFSIATKEKPMRLNVDPRISLLFEVKSIKRN